jgi:hypothetical protein
MVTNKKEQKTCGFAAKTYVATIKDTPIAELKKKKKKSNNFFIRITKHPKNLLNYRFLNSKINESFI